MARFNAMLKRLRCYNNRAEISEVGERVGLGTVWDRWFSVYPWFSGFFEKHNITIELIPKFPMWYPGPLLYVYSIYYRNKRLVNNRCTSLIVKILLLLLLFYYYYYQVNIFMACNYITANTCAHNRSHLAFSKSIYFCQNGRIKPKLHVEFKSNFWGNASQPH